MRLKYALLFIALLGTGIITPLFAAPPSRVRSLAGVEAVQVVVEDLNNATQKTGLQKEQIQAVAEKYLLEHGMKVVRGAGGAPIVYVRLSSVIGGDREHAPVSFYLTVQVKQFARLARRNATPVLSNLDDPPLLVTTWEDGTMVMLYRRELGFYVSQVLSNLLGALVQDCQEANGKGKG